MKRRAVGGTEGCSPRKSPYKSLLRHMDIDEPMSMPSETAGAHWRLGVEGPYGLRDCAPSPRDVSPLKLQGKASLPSFRSLFRTPDPAPGNPFYDSFESRRLIRAGLDGNFFLFSLKHPRYLVVHKNSRTQYKPAILL